MNRRLLTSLKLSLAASVMLAIGAAQAHAVDRKIYPGAECVRDYLSGGNPVYNSGICNFSGTPLNIECPVIHDANNGSSSTSGISSGWVRAVDMNPETGGEVKCRLNSAYFSNPSFTVLSTPPPSGQPQSTTGSGTYVQLLSFGSPSGTSAANSLANQIGHYWFSCTIPRRDPNNANNNSCVTSYQVTENGGNE